MITIDYIKANQEKHQHMGVMKQIFLHIDDLIDAHDFKGIDNFIQEFCKEKICFQYCVSMLTAALWVKNHIDNISMLRQRAIEAGELEFGHDETIKILHGLL